MHITNHLALLRNLRNIKQAGVSPAHIDKIKRALKSDEWARGSRRILPFRYVAAARACPQFEPALDTALLAAISELEPLSGTTLVLVDVSDSMNMKLSGKSDLSRMDAGATLASILPGTVRMFSFSNQVIEVPPRRGMAGVDAIKDSQVHSGTYLGKAITTLNEMPHDRLIVITDEQSNDQVPAPVAKRSYMINVASAKNGVGYGKGWTAHIDGFSEGVIRFIHEVEVAWEK